MVPALEHDYRVDSFGYDAELRCQVARCEVCRAPGRVDWSRRGGVPYKRGWLHRIWHDGLSTRRDYCAADLPSALRLQVYRQGGLL